VRRALACTHVGAAQAPPQGNKKRRAGQAGAAL